MVGERLHYLVRIVTLVRLWAFDAHHKAAIQAHKKAIDASSLK